jgi:L-alanine-DL-glutamate epimerase-like enolase superfamily enzyme
MTEYRFRASALERYERRVRFRIPFRFGASTVNGACQAFVRATIEFPDGTTQIGAAAEMMMPKWFDKSPLHSEADNAADLREALSSAVDAYSSDRTLRTGFGHHAANTRALRLAAEARGSNALTAAFGAALVDRALLDALCRRLQLSFWSAMRRNVAGIETGQLAPDLRGFDIDTFLANLQPRSEAAVRHTIGLLDPLVAEEVSLPADGLPQTLEEVIAVHRPRYFKVKLSGEVDADLRRIERIASVLDRALEAYHVTLDGNEQFRNVEGAVALSETVAADKRLARFVASTLWIEQPLAREVAERTDVGSLACFKPVLIDESDATLDAFPHARTLGYTGVSAKSCKGLYKSVLNAARCARWNAEGRKRFFLSAEDLTTQAGISLQQDLALVGLLAIAHVERNGHHYVDGFPGQGASDAEAERFLASHPDLYEVSHGAVRVSIRNGGLRFASLDTPGYAIAAEPDWSSLAGIGSTAVTEST